MSLCADSLSVSDIPWHRLVSSYGWAGGFPALFERISCSTCNEALRALDELAAEIEHQETLWPCTPFALVFLVRELKIASAQQNVSVAGRIIGILTCIAEVCSWALGMERADPLPCLTDMLDGKHLFPTEGTKTLSEHEFGFSDELFCSIYYFSFEILKSASEICRQLLGGALQPEAEQFLDALGRCAGI